MPVGWQVTYLAPILQAKSQELLEDLLEFREKLILAVPSPASARASNKRRSVQTFPIFGEDMYSVFEYANGNIRLHVGGSR